MSLSQVLDRPIAFQRSFVTITGSITAALMLSQAVYWGRRCSADGWFYKTQREWEDETGMTRSEQENARKVLRQKGFLAETKRGIPCKVYYRVNIPKISETLGIVSAASLQVSRILGCDNPASSDVGIPQTNTETTQRLHREAVSKVFDYYRETIGKSDLYTLTDLREQKGMARLRECLKKTKGNLENAKELMLHCVDAIDRSDFHMARAKYAGQKPFNDWEDQLFGSESKMEKWLEEAQRG